MGTFPFSSYGEFYLGSGDESLRNKCEFESYLLLLTYLTMSNSCALAPCVIGNKTKETAGYQSVFSSEIGSIDHQEMKEMSRKAQQFSCETL